MTHPEVVWRAQRAQRVVVGITEGSRSVGGGLAEVLARHALLGVLPEQVVPLLVAVQCTGAAASAGTVRVGDVELAKQLVDPALLGGTDEAIASSLIRLLDESPLDLAGLVRALESRRAPTAFAVGTVEDDVRALVAECARPWRDPALNVTVAQVPSRRGGPAHSRTAPPREWAQAIGAVLGAILAMALLAYALSSFLH